MYNADGLPDRIVQKDRQTVRGKDPQGNSRGTGDESVPFGLPYLLNILGGRIKENDPVSMDLTEGQKRKNLSAPVDRLSVPVLAGGLIPSRVSRAKAMNNSALSLPGINPQEFCFPHRIEP
jgi:hypothetical protein